MSIFHRPNVRFTLCLVPKMVSPGETLSSTAYSRRGGGKGANQAVAVARAGGEVALVGAVGSDGVWLKDELGRAGVDVEGVIVDAQVRRFVSLLFLVLSDEFGVLGTDWTGDHPAHA